VRHLRSAAVMAAIVALGACQEDSTGVAPPQQLAHPEGYNASAAPLKGFILGRDGEPMEIAYVIRDGSAIWDGDIDLGPAEWISPTASEALRRKDRQGPRLGVAIDGSTRRWPGGVVPYVIPSGFPSPSRITNAISHIESNTNGVDFVARTNESAYVSFRTSSGCSANVGRTGSVQYVNLASGCSKGNTIHELLHVLGLFHEHTRCDRDTFVLINTANIQSGYSNNFTKQCTGATDYHAYSEGSIMHYPPTAFSSNGLPTIVSLRGLDSQMGQRTGMNSVDQATINTLYP
jgi:hypothetical protein